MIPEPGKLFRAAWRQISISLPTPKAQKVASKGAPEIAVPLMRISARGLIRVVPRIGGEHESVRRGLLKDGASSISYYCWRVGQ